jgi:3-hydroxymyristoyl/3-hydroxydecanoyl-(acyl carrier protein) dehydratase
MRFLFVSRIHDIEENRIRGNVDFTVQEPWRRPGADGSLQISTSVVSEAIGQLVSWLSLRNNNFTARPVFLFASNINLDGYIPAPSTVELEAWITDGDQESFMFSGTAKVDGEVVVAITDCGGYFMPLAELEDPSVARKRFASLMSGDGSSIYSSIDSSIDSSTILKNRSTQVYGGRQLIDDVKNLELGRAVTAVKVMRQSEPFYADHFPRNPVTPIVVINEMIGEATRIMMEGEEFSALGRDDGYSFDSGDQICNLAPVAVTDLKIKSFILPGDTVVISVKKMGVLEKEFETIAEIVVNQKRILRGRYRYKFVDQVLRGESKNIATQDLSGRGDVCS